MNEKAVHSLRSRLSSRQIITDPEELLVYQIDAAQDRGIPDGVIFPNSTEDVCQIARWSSQHGIALISRGGGTGLSGGAVPEHGGWIVEFSRLNRILEIDTVGHSAVVEPGAITQTLDERTRAVDLYYPPDPSSGRASTLGGNVAENAGGPHCFKYGVTTNYITGLEAVLADGSHVRVGGRALDYPEYDFVSLLTGSEGTLGLITRIMVRLVLPPAGVKTLMAAFDTVEQAGRAVSAVIASGLVPATMEMMDQKIARIVEDFAHPGIPTSAGALLIMDVDGYPDSLDKQISEVARLVEKHAGFDLRIAQNSQEAERIWYARKSAAGAMARLAPAYLLLDGTVPRSRLAETLETTNRICEAYSLEVGYVFHAGDGNLHPFILMYPGEKGQVGRVLKAGREFMELVTRLGGSITGEHGVGIEKRPYLSLMYNPTELGAMLEVKEVFDPNGKLNPGKVFPNNAAEKAVPGPTSDLPAGEWEPASIADAASGLAGLTRAGRPVRICGSTQSPSLNQSGSVLLNTCRMNQLRELAPDDLYVTAEAGLRLSELQSVLAQEGKWLPAASPWSETSLGGLFSTNLNAPFRMKYGGLRDQVLAMTIVMADGRVIRVGRPVVKNVAGYDLAKLMVGSFGTLGLIADITLKFTAQPQCRTSLAFPAERLQEGLAWGQAGFSFARVASAIVLAHQVEIPTYSGISPNGFTLIYTAEGRQEDVDAELDGVARALSQQGAPLPLRIEDISGTDYWAAMLGPRYHESLRLRSAVAPKDLPNYLLSQSQLSAAPFLVDFASGFVYSALDNVEKQSASSSVDSLRKAALSLGGYLVVLDLPETIRGSLDAWGYQPDTLELMKRLKAKWDPAGILNRGSFLSGIDEIAGPMNVR